MGGQRKTKFAKRGRSFDTDAARGERRSGGIGLREAPLHTNREIENRGLALGFHSADRRQYKLMEGVRGPAESWAFIGRKRGSAICEVTRTGVR